MRLDLFLFESGKTQSRSKAQSAINAGEVTVDGKVIKKCSFDVRGDEDIRIENTAQFVSRAGEKLSHALKIFGVGAEGLTALDIGASTGGFTDCLLQNGAKRVFALDVGFDQLDARIRNDERVTVIENFNARNAKRSDFDSKIDIIVMDVSFISQTLIYPACADILDSGCDMITLIKPQFEAGRQNIGKGGIVHDRDGSVIAEIMKKLSSAAAENGFELIAKADSPILGGDGNKEYLAHFKKI